MRRRLARCAVVDLVRSHGRTRIVPACPELAAWRHDRTGVLICHGHYERGTGGLICELGETTVTFGSLATFSPLAS